MKLNKNLILIIAGITVGITGQAQTILPGDISSGVSPTFTTADAFVTLHGYSDSASTVPSDFYSAGAGNYFGVNPNNSMNGTDTMTMQFAPGVGLSGFGAIWTRAVISISGFTSDPELNVGSDPNVISSGYSGGVLTLSLNWDSGTPYSFTLANPGASAGQLLTASLDYATAPQWAITEISYAPVPEPSTTAMSLLGLAALGLARRFRR